VIDSVLALTWLVTAGCLSLIAGALVLAGLSRSRDTSYWAVAAMATILAVLSLVMAGLWSYSALQEPAPTHSCSPPAPPADGKPPVVLC